MCTSAALADLVRFLDGTVAEISGPVTAVSAASPLIAALGDDVEARHREFEIVAARISQGATRIALLQRPPVPDIDLRPIVDDLRTSAVALLHLYRVIRPNEGTTYRDELQSACVGLFSGLADLANSVLDKDTRVPLTHVAPYLFNTGMIWKAAELFPKLPKSNRQAVMAVWEARRVMIEDAIGELEELMKRTIVGQSVDNSDGDDDNDDNDDDDGDGDDMPLLEDEHDRVKTGLALVRLMRLLGCKLTSKRIEPLREPLDDLTISWLDQVTLAMTAASSAVDDLSVALYPRHDLNELKSGTVSVVHCATALLDLLSTFPISGPVLAAADEDWFAKMRVHVHTYGNKLL